MNKFSKSMVFQIRGRVGAVVPLLAFLIIMLLAIIALVLDVAMMELTRIELKRTADAAALAAAAELVPDARPQFPLKSPVPINVNIPKVLAVNLENSLDTSIGVGGSTLVLIDTKKQVPEIAAWKAAELYGRFNPVSGTNDFVIAKNDVVVSRRPDAMPGRNLLPLPESLQGLGGAVESILLAGATETHKNSVQVTTHRTNKVNGPVSLAFAPIFGILNAELSQTSTATFYKAYGVRPGAPVLPIAMDVTVWRAIRVGNGIVNGVPLAQALLTGNGQPLVLLDEQQWDPKTNSVSPGSDGVWEVVVLNRPLDEINVSGILDGVLDKLPIGGGLGGFVGKLPVDQVLRTPSTIVVLNLSKSGVIPYPDKVARQIQSGLNASDMNESMMLPFTCFGEQAVSADMVADLKRIIGQPRIIPLFETLNGTAINKVRGLAGAREPYRIVGFGGVVVTEVLDLGVVKAIKLQPATVTSPYVVPAADSQSGIYSDCVYTCPFLTE